MNWEFLLHTDGSVRCAFTPRTSPDAQGVERVVRPVLVPFIGHHVDVTPMWRMGEGDSYEGEHALSVSSAGSERGFFGTFVYWISSGDLTPLEEFPCRQYRYVDAPTTGRPFDLLDRHRLFRGDYYYESWHRDMDAPEEVQTWSTVPEKVLDSKSPGGWFLAFTRQVAFRYPMRPCECAPGEFDHDWKWVSDFEGDCGVVNGTNDISHYVCQVCGLEDHEALPPEYDDPFDGWED